MKRAIDGICRSPYHIRKNKDGNLYVDWENHIFRKYKQIENRNNHEPQQKRSSNGSNSVTNIAAISAAVADLEVAIALGEMAIRMGEKMEVERLGLLMKALDLQ